VLYQLDAQSAGLAEQNVLSIERTFQP
jgi:hypothetical protein